MMSIAGAGVGRPEADGGPAAALEPARDVGRHVMVGAGAAVGLNSAGSPAARAEQLQAAAMAMIEPLIRPAAVQDLGRDLADAVEHCANTAAQNDLRGIGYLSAIVAPFLRKGGMRLDDPASRELLETWLNDLLAFCVGQLPLRDTRVLVDQLLLWPRLARLPPEFADLIVERLANDGKLLAAMHRSMHRAMPEPEIDDATALFESDAQIDRGPEVGADELALLADEAGSLENRTLPRLLSLEPGTGFADQLGTIADEVAESMGAMANALQFMNLDGLSRALLDVRAEIESASVAQPREPERRHRLLIELPCALRGYFESPDPDTMAALTQVLSAWVDGRTLAGLGALACLQVTSTRKAQGTTFSIDDADLSVGIPVDADAAVVAQLRRELPRLCEAFAKCVTRLSDGDIASISEAQRIAHTLKGAASTVGVSGAAALTHQLEDLLQLLQTGALRFDAGLSDLLERASDMLFAIDEAVSGMAGSPVGLETLHAELAQRVGQVHESAASNPDHSDVSMERSGSGPGSGVGAKSQAGLLDPSESGRLDASNPQEDQLEPTVDAAARGQGHYQVSAATLERMLDAIHQSSIKLAQLQTQVAAIDASRQSLRGSNEGLEDLASELERMVDVRGVALSARSAHSDFDPIELDEYNDLQTLSRRIAEVGADQRVIDRQLDQPLLEIKELGDQIERLQFELQEVAEGTRRVRVRTVTARLRRAVRQAARMSAKQAQLDIQGEDVEIDGEMLDVLVDSLTHLLRNAVDHGIEPPAERSARGKPELGSVRLSFSRRPASMLITCEDDGGGVDFDRVFRRAIECGLANNDEQAQVMHDPKRLAEVLTAPGFSTRERISELSGRGIGLDVVRQALRGLRGTLEISSTPAQGTRFVINIPLRVATRPVLVVHDERYCLAIVADPIEEVLAASSLAVDPSGRQLALTSNGAVPVRALTVLLGLSSSAFASSASLSMLLVVRCVDGSRCAILTPPLGQARKVMVRALPAWVPAGIGVVGVAVLGEGSVAPVLDPALLLTAPSSELGGFVREVELPESPRPVCLVVDDSVSVRRSMELFLQDIGLKPVGASDGLQALERARREKPALVIVDFEMPRMNGIEFAKAFRGDAQFAGIPIIMITSRSSAKHRKRALEAGVDVFMTKPYTEDAVASEVQRCLLSKIG